MNSDITRLHAKPEARAGICRKETRYRADEKRRLRSSARHEGAGAMMLFCMRHLSFCVIRVGKARRVCTARLSVVTDPLTKASAPGCSRPPPHHQRRG